MKRFVFALALACAGVLAVRPALAAPPAAGTKAPAFTVTDLDGQQVSLSDLYGKVVFLDFWATWCPPCRMSLPHTQDISTWQQVKDGELVVLAISSEDEGDVKPFLAKNNYTFRTVAGSDVSDAYGVEGIPTFVVIGRDGLVVDTKVGWGDSVAAALDQSLATALKAPKPADAVDKPAVAADPSAPADFEAKLLDGKSVKLSDYKGKVVLVDFWATWCPPCQKSLPHTQKISQRPEVKDGKLVVLGVSCDKDEAAVKAFMADKKYTFPTVVSVKAAQANKVENIPTFLVIGKDGKIAKRIVGYGGDGTAKSLDEAIDAALAAEAEPAPAEAEQSPTEPEPAK